MKKYRFGLSIFRGSLFALALVLISSSVWLAWNAYGGVFAFCAMLAISVYAFKVNAWRHKNGFPRTFTDPNHFVFYSLVILTVVATDIWIKFQFNMNPWLLASLFPFVFGACVILCASLYGALRWISKTRLAYFLYRRLIGDDRPMPITALDALPRATSGWEKPKMLERLSGIAFGIVFVAVVLIACLLGSLFELAFESKPFAFLERLYHRIVYREAARVASLLPSM